MAANFQIWERSVAPAGELILPQGSTIGEAFGSGLQNLGEAGERVALAERDAQDRIQQKNDDAWVGKQKPQAIIDLDKINADLEGSAEAGAPDHIGKVAKAVDDYTAQLLKQAPDDRTKAELEDYVGTLKAEYLVQAGQFQKASELTLRSSNIHQAALQWGDILSRDPGKYDTAIKAMQATIAAQNLSPDKATDFSNGIAQELGTIAVTAQARSDPSGFLKGFQGGEWDGKADPQALLQAKGDAEHALQVQRIETQQQQVIAQQKNQVDVDWRFSKIMPQIENGVLPDSAGKIDGISVPTEQEILTVYPGEPGEAMVRTLRNSKQIGLDHKAIWSGTQADNDALLRSIKPVDDQAATPEQEKRYAMTLAQVTEKRNLLRSDPATAAVRINPEVAAAWDTFLQTQRDVADNKATPSDLIAAAKRAVALSQAEQKRQGVEESQLRSLPQAIVDASKNAIAAGNPEQIAATVDKMHELFGDSGLHDLVSAGAPAGIIPLASADQPAEAPWRASLIRVWMSTVPELEAQAHGKAGFSKNDLDDAIRRVNPGLLKALPSNYVDAIIRVGLERGIAGFNLNDAAQFAIKPFTDAYQFHENAYGGGAFMVPRNVDDEKVVAGLTTIATKIGQFCDIAAEDDLSGNPISADDAAYRVRQQKKRIQSGAYGWINNKSNDGVRLIYETGDPVLQLGADGKSYPVEVKFVVAQAVQPEVLKYSPMAKGAPNLRPRVPRNKVIGARSGAQL